ncbi:MAG: hypothetical protein MAG431_01716 [Chloroflexi bacterium]|nr:hypothetical protein [Chloroflexota bacterium]
MNPFQKLKTMNREHLAWYMYDFGNSAYAAVILLAVYSAYFKGAVVGGAEGSRLWGISVGVAMLVVAVSSPILGAIADFSASKKRMLLLFSGMTWIFTGLLFFVREGTIIMGMVFFILAEIGYRSGQVFYNSLLPEIAEPEEMGRVSGNAWAVGSFGGILALLILLPLIISIEGDLIIRLSMVFTSLYFALSTIPTILWIKEKAEPKPLPEDKNFLTVGFIQLIDTIKSLGGFKDFIRFMVAFLIYNDGILMALDFAAIIGAVLFGMKQQEIIIFMIVVQVASVLGAWAAGVAGDKIGYKRSLIISLILMTAAVLAMIFAQNQVHFYLIGAVAGLALTGVQSISRALIGYFAPKDRSAEFYGLFAVTGRTSSFIGPTIYGFLAAQMAWWYEGRGVETLLAEQYGQRVAIGSIAIFLIAGLLVLLKVNDPTKKYIKS